MSPLIILIVIAAYCALLFFVVWRTSRSADNQSYFIGNRQSPWYVVAYGMIGASISGVTFISVPGAVFTTQFSYLQVVAGYMVGYMVIALVLMPVYYKLNLTSIYTYLESRFGTVTYKTGSLFFIISRVIGAGFRMYIVLNVLQTFVFDAWHVPFILTVFVFIVLILLYTYEGGVKTIVWTDTLQTTFMLFTVLFVIGFLIHESGSGISDWISKATQAGYTKIFVGDWHSPNFFWKNFLGGAGITIAMTGLDQEMMQKNLSCKNIGEAKKNMFTFAAILILVNLVFLFLGAILSIAAPLQGLTFDAAHTDNIFPTMALQYLGVIPALIFVVGIISAAFPSADGALTALTTAFTFDFLGIHKNRNLTEQKRKNIRYIVHISFALVLLGVISIFKILNDDAVIRNLFKAASYTYGPLLGLYAFGFFTKRKIADKFSWLMCLIGPVSCWFLNDHAVQWFNGYKFGFELILLNATITFIGLSFISFKQKQHIQTT